GDDQITNIETAVPTEPLPAQMLLGNLDQSDLETLFAIYRPFWTGENFSQSRIVIDDDNPSNLVWYISLDPTDWAETSLFSQLVKSFTYIAGNLHIKLTVYNMSLYNPFTFSATYIPPGGNIMSSLPMSQNMPLVQIDMDGNYMREIPINIPQSCATEVIPTAYAGYSDLSRKTWGRLSGSGWGTLMVSIQQRVIGSNKIRASWWMDARITNARAYMPRIVKAVSKASDEKRPFSLTTRSAGPLWTPSQ
nr:VP1 [Oscivirus A2]